MNSEAILQQTLVAQLRAFYPDILISLSMSGVSLNGSTRQNAQTMQALSTQGFIKGLPDLVLYLPEGKLLNLELKRPNGGFQSQYQIAVQRILTTLGHNYYIIRSTEQVFDLIAAHTSTNFRELQCNKLVLPQSATIIESFLFWPKGTSTSLIAHELSLLYRI